MGADNKIIEMGAIYVHDLTGVEVVILEVDTFSGGVCVKCQGVESKSFELRCPLSDLTRTDRKVA